jgi:hypothetical protein
MIELINISNSVRNKILYSLERGYSAYHVNNFVFYILEYTRLISNEQFCRWARIKLIKGLLFTLKTYGNKEATQKHSHAFNRSNIHLLCNESFSLVTNHTNAIYLHLRHTTRKYSKILIVKQTGFTNVTKYSSELQILGDPRLNNVRMSFK